MAENPLETLNTAKPSIEQILQNIDDLPGTPENSGIKLLDAWEYRKAVMAKYGLPELETNPVQYIRKMEDLLKNNNVDIRGVYEFDRFFKENPGANAVNLRKHALNSNTVVVGAASGSDLERLTARGRALAHEGIHALQGIYYPRMPFEEQEREAYYYEYLAPWLILSNKDNSEFLKEVILVLEEKIKYSTIVDEELERKAKRDK